MKKYVILILYLFLFCGNASSENLSGGARPLALSNAYVAVSDIWSAFHNQAGIAGIKTITGGVFYTSRFGIKELAQMDCVLILPVSRGTFGLSYARFGTGTFRDTKLGLAFAKKLGRKIDAGIQFDYFALHIPENKNAATSITFEGGILYKQQYIRQIFQRESSSSNLAFRFKLLYFKKRTHFLRGGKKQ